MGAIISLPAESLRQAITTALAVVEAAAGGPVVVIEVMTSDESNARLGWAPLPELVSITEAAARLGVSRQAEHQRVESGSLPGQKVGSTWVVQAASLS